MMQTASVRFHMYTTQRFLELAPKFLSLTPEPAKKAASEFAEIEKQDKQYAWVAPDLSKWVLDSRYTVTPVLPVSLFNTTPAPDSPFHVTTMGLSDTPVIQASSAFIDAAIDSTHLALLPINGMAFKSSTGLWTCEITGTLATPDKTRACYNLKFDKQVIGSSRQLTLWLSATALENDPEWKYKRAVYRLISEWLDSGQLSGAYTYLP